MCDTDYNEPSFYCSSNVKAIKAHKCSDCRREIKKGETYTRATGKWEGTCKTYKTCQHCRIVQKWLHTECGVFPHDSGDLYREIQDHAFEYKKMFLYRWLVGINTGWRQEILRIK